MVFPHNFPNKKLFLLPERTSERASEKKKPDGMIDECVSATEKNIHRALWSGKLWKWTGIERVEGVGETSGSMTHNNNGNEESLVKTDESIREGEVMASKWFNPSPIDLNREQHQRIMVHYDFLFVSKTADLTLNCFSITALRSLSNKKLRSVLIIY